MAYSTWMGEETNNVQGAFVRQANQFTTPFGNGAGELPVEAGRYRLIWSAICPWATRQMIVRELLGMESAFTVGMVDPIRPEKPYADWAFTLDPDGVDPVFKVPFLSDLYRNANPDYTGRFTVPAVVDIPTKKVVNNDYFNLTYYIT